jgi:hypothetical protein
MKPFLKTISFFLSYIGCLYLYTKAICFPNFTEPVWKLVWWAPSVLVVFTLFTISYHSIKRTSLRLLIAAPLAIAGAFASDWLQLWFRYGTPMPFPWEATDHAEFYFFVVYPFKIFASAALFAFFVTVVRHQLKRTCQPLLGFSCPFSHRT